MKRKKGYIWTGACIGVLAYILLLTLSVFHVPMSLFLRMLPPVVAVVLLIRNTPLWIKIVVGLLLVLAGVYVLFCNNIIGPLEFAISDRPINVPAQFYYSWRYFWVMEYLYIVLWTWGIPSIILILGYRAWVIWKKRCNG